MNSRAFNIKKQLQEYYGNNPILFLKFSDAIERLEQIKAGSLYMNNFKYYIDLEELSGKAGMGDRLETSYIMYDVDVSVSDEETDEIIERVTAESAIFRYDEALMKPVFCLYAVTIDMLEVVEVNKDRVKCILKFSEGQIANIKESFGEYVLIINAPPFLSKVKKSFKEKQYECLGRFVNYSDYSILDIKRFTDHIEGKASLFFSKEKAFAHQKEYRLVIFNKEITKGYKEQIESLENDSAIYSINILGSDKGISWEVKSNSEQSAN